MTDTKIAIPIGSPLKTLDGRDAIVLDDMGADGAPVEGKPLLGKVRQNDGKWGGSTWWRDGRWSKAGTTSHDLQMPSTTFWINLYPDGSRFTFPSRHAADRRATPDRIACKEVTITVGEGLS